MSNDFGGCLPPPAACNPLLGPCDFIPSYGCGDFGDCGPGGVPIGQNIAPRTTGGGAIPLNGGQPIWPYVKDFFCGNSPSDIILTDAGIGAAIGAGEGAIAGGAGGEFGEPLGGGVPGAWAGGYIGAHFGFIDGLYKGAFAATVCHAFGVY